MPVRQSSDAARSVQLRMRVRTLVVAANRETTTQPANAQNTQNTVSQPDRQTDINTQTAG